MVMVVMKLLVVEVLVVMMMVVRMRMATMAMSAMPRLSDARDAENHRGRHQGQGFQRFGYAVHACSF